MHAVILIPDLDAACAAGNPEAPDNLVDLPPGQGYEYHTTGLLEDPEGEKRHYKTVPVTRPYRR